MHNDSDTDMLTSSENFPCTCLTLSRKRKQQLLSDNSPRLRRYSRRKFYEFLFIFYLVLPTGTMSLPLPDKRPPPNKTNNKAVATAENPHWVNPCPGVPNSSSSGTEKRSVSEDENAGPEADYINSIVLTSKHAMYQAEKFRENYVWRTFSIEYEKHHTNWKSAKYGWLTQEVIVPKGLGEKVSVQELEKMEMDEITLKIYGYLQRLAIAFEQVIRDQREANSEFQEEFAIAEIHLKSILCELREIIPESKFAQYQNANRDIMPLEFRHMEDHTYRHVRDWLIFRDYMNVVEYLIQVLEYFKMKTV